MGFEPRCLVRSAEFRPLGHQDTPPPPLPPPAWLPNIEIYFLLKYHDWMGFYTRSRIFHLCWDVISYTGRWNARNIYLCSMCRGDSLMCHACCDSVPSVFKVPRVLGKRMVTIYIHVLARSWPGLEPTNSGLHSEHSTNVTTCTNVIKNVEVFYDNSEKIAYLLLQNSPFKNFWTPTPILINNCHVLLFIHSYM